MLLDTSLYGGFTALKSGAKVFAWVAASGAVAAVIAYMNSVTVDPSDVLKLAALALVNSALVSAKKWLTSVRPFTAPELAEGIA